MRNSRLHMITHARRLGTGIERFRQARIRDPAARHCAANYRAVAQVYASGAIQITTTNAYSGNNGRAAIQANGYFYTVGNSNNGGGTPDDVVGSTGVQIIVPGQLAAASSAGTPPVGNFSITQLTDPGTGAPYAPDKPGKDNNYRGLTIFNNTLYVTKGSGSNGINTVYQVGNPQSLPTVTTAATTPITILPGFPTTLARSAGATNPFGIWFADARTLYVADEGDGTTANAATSNAAGLQKWVRVNGVWQLDYVLQTGLDLGVQFHSELPDSFESRDGRPSEHHRPRQWRRDRHDLGGHLDRQRKWGSGRGPQ